VYVLQKRLTVSGRTTNYKYWWTARITIKLLPVTRHRRTMRTIDAATGFASYEDFFTFYLHEHSDARNRAMHAVGTLLGLGTLIVAFAVGHPGRRSVARGVLRLCLIGHS